MRMSHEIFNMEWSNRDSIYLHTRDGVLYSAFAGSAERLLSLVGGLRRGAALQVLLVRAGVSGRPLYTCKKDSGVFSGKLHFY